MNPLLLELRDQKTAFRPGEEISGAAYWKMEKGVQSIEVRLFWHTRGKGTEDVHIVDHFRFENPKPEEARPFSFEAPEEPYSFSGKLISLIWGLELVLEPGAQSTRLDITISPTGQELILGEAVPKQEKHGQLL